MKDLLIYIGQSGVCVSIFMLVYFLLLRGRTFFKFNRIFLIVGLLTSFVLPSIKFTYDVIVPNIFFTDMVREISPNLQLANQGESINFWHILSIIYFFGVGFLLLRNLRLFWNLRALKHSGAISKNDKWELITNQKIKTPFSVFNQVYINADGLQPKEKDIILKHEISHIKQKHWIDLLCSECALLLLWFNPLMWYYIYLQKENHEYLADQAVLESGESTAIYRAVLINQRFQGPVFSFANSFNYSNKKNRLNMMNKTKTSPWKKIAVLAVLPLFGAFFALSAKPNYVFEEMTLSAKADSTIVLVADNSAKNEASPLALTLDGLKLVYDNGEASQITSENGAVIKVKNSDKEPLVIVNGKEIPFAEMEKIDVKTIKTVDVLKDDNAVGEYGERAKNGVFVIKTNSAAKDSESDEDKSESDITVLGYKGNVTYSDGKESTLILRGAKSPLLMVDGVEVEIEEFERLDVSEIENVNVLKGATAKKLYGEKGNNGVIKVTTKKEK